MIFIITMLDLLYFTMNSNFHLFYRLAFKKSVDQDGRSEFSLFADSGIVRQ